MPIPMSVGPPWSRPPPCTPDLSPPKCFFEILPESLVARVLCDSHQEMVLHDALAHAGNLHSVLHASTIASCCLIKFFHFSRLLRKSLMSNPAVRILTRKPARIPPFGAEASTILRHNSSSLLSCSLGSKTTVSSCHRRPCAQSSSRPKNERGFVSILVSIDVISCCNSRSWSYILKTHNQKGHRTHTLFVNVTAKIDWSILEVGLPLPESSKKDKRLSEPSWLT